MKRSQLRRRAPLRKIGKRGRQRSLRKKLWPTFSKLIRLRDQRCLFAGYFGSRCGGTLQAAHIYPKGKYPLLELFPLNVVAACYACHLFGWHRSPLDAAKWVHDLPSDWQVKLEREKKYSLLRKGMTEAQIYAEWKLYGLTP